MAHLLDRKRRPMEQPCAVGLLGCRSHWPYLIEAREEAGVVVEEGDGLVRVRV
jgi:hypothetical protein